MSSRAALALLLLTTSLWMFTALASAQAPGTVTGVVFHDGNSNGIDDSADAAIQHRTVRLLQGGTTVRATESDLNGVYAFTGVDPGDYTVSVEPDAQFPGECGQNESPFDPLAFSDCLPPILERWTAVTPASVTITVTDGGNVQVDFALRPPISMVAVGGVALVNGDWAPVGTSVTAEYGGHDCGAAQVSRQHGARVHTFDLMLHLTNHTAGCPSDENHAWSFRVGDVPAAETLTVFAAAEGGFGGLSALPDHAWYWVEKIGSGPSGNFQQATINGVVCGEAQVQKGTNDGADVIGFSRLVVPSDSIKPGCGRPGAVVTFTHGTDAVTTPWKPGLQRIDLPLEKPVLVIDGPGSLPALGGPPARRAGSLLPRGALVALAGLVVAAGVIHGSRHSHSRAHPSGRRER